MAELRHARGDIKKYRIWSHYNPDSWVGIPATWATYKRMDECMALFAEFAGPDGEWYNDDHFLTFAMIKLTEYRKKELAAPQGEVADEAEAAGNEEYVRKAIPPKTRAAVLLRDGHKCTRCGATEDLHLHHLVLVSEGGDNEADNLVTLCRGCHADVHRERGDHYHELIAAGVEKSSPLHLAPSDERIT
jgi:hypothetical protein